MKELPKSTRFAPCIDSKTREDTIWATLNDEEVDLFNRNAICREYTPGESIFMQGEPCNGLYFVEDGLVGVRKIDIDGHSILIRVVAKGETLGYRPFLAKQPHRASAEVIEDSKVYFINAPTVRKILQSNHELGLRFLERTAQAFGEAEERLLEMAVLTVDTRIIHLLVLYHDQWGKHLADGSFVIRLPITREDIASMIGAHPDSVSRAMRALESKGIFNADGRMIHVEKYDRLTDQLHTDLIQ